MAQVQLRPKKTINRKFVSKMKNFETSLRYEGLFVKNENKNKSVVELRQKYAR